MNKEILYAILIDEANSILKSNPCNIQIKNNKTTCDGELGEPCCPHACKMLSTTGCITNNIGCKIWFCTEAINNLKNNNELFEKWVELSGIIGKLQIKDKKYKHQQDIINQLNPNNLSKLKQQYSILSKIFKP